MNGGGAVLRAKGWGGFLAARCKSPWQQALANNRGDDKKPPRVCVDGVSAKAERKKQPGEDHAPLLVHPSLLDGLSFPMSVVFAVRQLKWRPPRDQPLTILMLGATYKAGTVYPVWCFIHAWTGSSNERVRLS